MADMSCVLPVVQMAFQAAYYSLYGRTECTYEPAMTKSFLHGRTESIRTVQKESVDFVRTFCSAEASPRQKMDALRVACKRHTELTRECSKGLGQDRILYAMANLAKDPTLGSENGNGNGNGSLDGTGPMSDEQKASDNGPGEVVMPAFFRDPGYAALNHSTLSTSNCGNPCLRLFGFGAVVPDGFGIGYIIKDDGLSVCASSKHLQTQRYLDTLRAYLLEVQRMLQQLYREANARPTSGIFSSISKEDEENDFGYGFYGDFDDALSQITKSARRSARNIGTKIQLLDY